MQASIIIIFIALVKKSVHEIWHYAVKMQHYRVL